MKGFPFGKLKNFVLRMYSTFSGLAVTMVRRFPRRGIEMVCDGERRRSSVYHWRRRRRFLLKESVEPMSGYALGPFAVVSWIFFVEYDDKIKRMIITRTARRKMFRRNAIFFLS